MLCLSNMSNKQKIKYETHIRSRFGSRHFGSMFHLIVLVILVQPCGCIKATVMARPRSSTTKFPVADLVETLSVHAQLKHCGFDFELSNYSKTRRSQGPDRAGLLHYHILLQGVLKHAPNGFPNHMILKETWLALNKKYDIMDQHLKLSGMALPAWADSCADSVCRACRHVVDLSRSGTDFLHPDVKALADSIREETPSTRPASTPTSTDPLTLHTL